MLTELLGKGGKLCQPAREGALRCPLMVRPTSEDVITGQVFGTLRAIQPRWWLPALLNRGLGAERFRQQVYRRLSIEPWQNRPHFPRELLPWAEGSTQVDVTIRWENPPTTVFIEVKYLSSLAPRTAQSNGQHGFPADQLMRNIRVGLWECGYFRPDGLFQQPVRDFVMLVLAPETGDSKVTAYRDPSVVRNSLPAAGCLRGLPRTPWIGEVGYRDLRALLLAQRRFASVVERRLMDDLADYLLFKLQARPSG